MLERMYALFKQRKITYKEIAENIGISSATLSEWKHNETLPNLQKAVAIADYLDVSLDYLVGRDKFASDHLADERELLAIYSGLQTSGKVAILKEAYKQKKQANENERKKDAPKRSRRFAII